MQPLYHLFIVFVSFVIWPPLVPYVAWIPVLGPMLLGDSVPASSDRSSAGVLTGRLERIVFLRAASSAAGVSPASAVVAFGGAEGVAATAVALLASIAQRLRRNDGATAVKGGRQQEHEGYAQSESSRHLVREYVFSRLAAADRRLHPGSVGAKSTSV
jgi:hypothetical protein